MPGGWGPESDGGGPPSGRSECNLQIRVRGGGGGGRAGFGGWWGGEGGETNSRCLPDLVEAMEEPERN